MFDLTAVSLFAGVGGFDLALSRAGIKVCAAVEIDKKCREVLGKHFPETKLFDDVKEVTGEQLRSAGFIPERGILTGGFPCQDLSIAGLRKGLDGERSGLFHEIMRLTDELQPQFIILENVVGLLSSQSGKDMGIVITALVERGYGVCWRVLDSQNFGVPQRRRRVFIVASFGDHRRPVEILFERESLSGYFESGGKKRKNTSKRIDGSFDEAGSNSINSAALFEGNRVGDPRVNENISPSLTARWGTGGNNVPFLAFPFHGGMVGRKLENGPSGSGFKDADDSSFTLTASSQAIHGVVINQTPRLATNRERTNTITANIYHHGTVVNQDLSDGHLVFDEPILLRNRGGKPDSGKRPLLSEDKSLTIATNNDQTLFSKNMVRRLTPKECERLQGFPDDWTASQADSSRYKMMGNAVTVPVVEWIVQRMVKLISE